LLTNAYVADSFPDPTNAAHVLALASADGSAAIALYESNDGGLTFSGPRYSPPAMADFDLTGVEIAQTSPQTIYLTTSAGVGTGPFVIRSLDGGANFELIDLVATVGGNVLRIAAVDPTRAQRLYLRVLSSKGNDLLAISDDGGATLRLPVQVTGRMSAFLRRADGTLLIGARQGSSFISRDDGKTFVKWTGAPHLRALGERAGALFAAADNTVDGYAVGRSSDGGASWTPLLRFDQIKGPLQCGQLQSVCAGPWELLKARLGIGSPPLADMAMTSSSPDSGMPSSLDSGVPAESTPDLAAAMGTPSDPGMASSPTGCGCEVGQRHDQRHSVTGIGAILAMGAALAMRSRRQRRLRTRMASPCSCPTKRRPCTDPAQLRRAITASRRFASRARGG
jgi:hypothetical protein